MTKMTTELLDCEKTKPKKKSRSIAEKTKENFEVLMKPVGVLEADTDLRQDFNAYAGTHLDRCTNRIKQCVYNVTSNFIEIGFRLWECQEYKYYKYLGFDGVCEYALSELGFKKSSTRNFIRVYERFCGHDIVKKLSNWEKSGGMVLGNYCLLEKYKDFTYSQLTELLALSDSQIEAIAPAPADTVKQIRDKKQGLYEEAEQWLHDAIIDAVGGKLGFKKQIYEYYEENKSASKLASFIKKNMKLKIESGGVVFDDKSRCIFNGTRVIFYHSVYFPQDKIMRWFDVAEKIAGYIEAGTFLSEQVHIDELAEELAEEMAAEVPKSETVRADEQRPYKIELYKDDIDIILKSLKAADVPQDTYKRIYETIGKAEIL
ncbi:MAG: hypothetical protein NC085_12315 [Muribaculaceae bacterium]|nr:hypothetical protein [Muribaculaceae bacterium]MCM1480481.1 hypothetical protein [Muribaculaceae bacterium]